VIVADPPKATAEPLKVTELLVRLLFAILDSVLLDPLIVLLVSVSEPVKVANVPVVGNVTLVAPVRVLVYAKLPDDVTVADALFATPVPPLAGPKVPARVTEPVVDVLGVKPAILVWKDVTPDATAVVHCGAVAPEFTVRY
jgi:hypothetical protein